MNLVTDRELPPYDEAFWSKVNINLDGCWLWQGKVYNYGYGRYKGQYSHRYAFNQLNGFYPEQVNHSCDIPACVNPFHLEAGNPLKNMQDAKARGRLAMGDKHPAAKLSTEKVKEIRQKAQQGIKRAVLALEYNVDYFTITDVILGRTWRHV